MSDEFILIGGIVSTSDTTLKTFLIDVSKAYDQLEEAITPVDEKIADLERDWHVRPGEFWGGILDKDIPAIAVAARTCLSFFEDDRGKIPKMPISIRATRFAYLVGLHLINAKIEEAGIRLTAYLDSHGTRSHSMEDKIRQRQHLKSAIEDVTRAARRAINEGRAELKQAPAEQAKLLAPPPKPKHRQAEPDLRVVPSQEALSKEERGQR